MGLCGILLLFWMTQAPSGTIAFPSTAEALSVCLGRGSSEGTCLPLACCAKGLLFCVNILDTPRLRQVREEGGHERTGAWPSSLVGVSRLRL